MFALRIYDAGHVVLPLGRKLTAQPFRIGRHPGAGFPPEFILTRTVPDASANPTEIIFRVYGYFPANQPEVVELAARPRLRLLRYMASKSRPSYIEKSNFFGS